MPYIFFPSSSRSPEVLVEDSLNIIYNIILIWHPTCLIGLHFIPNDSRICNIMCTMIPDTFGSGSSLSLQRNVFIFLYTRAHIQYTRSKSYTQMQYPTCTNLCFSIRVKLQSISVKRCLLIKLNGIIFFNNIFLLKTLCQVIP